MPKFIVSAPNGKKYEVEGPEGSTQDDAISFVRAQLGDLPSVEVPEDDSDIDALFGTYEPKRGLGEAFTKGVSRGASRLGSTITDVLPALGASALGFDEYARGQMEEAAAKEAELQQFNPAQFESFRDIQGVGDFLTYLAELSGEQVPNLLTSIGTGGAGAAIAGTAARRAAAAGLQSRWGAMAALPAAKQMAKEAGRGAVAKGAVIGAGAGSIGLNTPEIFQNIYEETGKLEPALATIFGTVSGALDTIFPAAVVKSLQSNPALKKAVVATVAERKGILPEVLKGATKAAALEGATEGTQEALSIEAERIASDMQKFWGQKEFDRVLESAVAGALVSAPLGGIGGGAAAIRSRPAPEEAPPEASAPVTPDIFKVAPPAEGEAAKGSVFDRIAAASTKEELDAIQTEIKNIRDISNTAIRDKYQPAISARREQLKEEAAKKPVKPIDTTNMPAGMSEEEWASLEANPPGGKKASAAPTVTVNKEFVNKVKASIAATVSAGNPVSIAEISEKSGLKTAKDLKKLVDSLLKAGTLRPTNQPFVYSYGTPKTAGVTQTTDTSVADEGAADTSVADEGAADTSVADEGAADTSVADEGAADTSVADVIPTKAKEEVAKPKLKVVEAANTPEFKSISEQVGSDYAAIDQTLGRESALDHLAGDLVSASTPGKINAPSFGTSEQDFVDVTAEGRDEFYANFPRSRGAYAQNFWNSLNDDEKKYVKKKAVDLYKIKVPKGRVRNKIVIGDVIESETEYEAASARLSELADEVAALKESKEADKLFKDISESGREFSNATDEIKARRDLDPDVEIPNVLTKLAEKEAESTALEKRLSNAVLVRESELDTRTRKERIKELTDIGLSKAEAEAEVEASIAEEAKKAERKRDVEGKTEQDIRKAEIRLAALERAAVRANAEFERTNSKEAMLRLRELDGKIQETLFEYPTLADRVPAYSKRNGVALAAFVPSEKLAVYAPGLSAKEMRALRVHEVGAHYSVEKMIGSDRYQQLLRDLSALRGKSKMVDTAYRLVPRDTPSYLVNHEALAYLVEHYERLPLVKRLLQAVKDWWNKTFKGQTLTPTYLRKLTQAAMKKYETDVREEILTSGTVEERVKDYPDVQFSRGQKLLANSSDLASNSQYLYDRLANASDAALAKVPAWGQGVATKIADFIEMGPVRGSGRVLAGLLDMRQLAEVAGRRNPELGAAIKKVERVVGERDRDMAKGREEVEKFLKHASEVVKSVTPEQRKAFNRVVNESTLRQIDPTTDRDHFLAKDYDALPQSLQKLYVELRDTYAKFVEDYTDILRNEPVLGPASKVLADLMSKGIKPYFPLHRRGEFWLQYIDPTTKEEAVSAFETPRERREFVRFLQANGAEAKDIVEFARIANVTTESLPPTSQFRKVLQTLRESGKVEQPVIDEVYKMYLDLFPNQSIMQQFHTRKGTAGFLEDPINVYADVGTRMAMNLAQVKSMKKIDDALDEAKGATSERASGFDATIIDSLEGRERYLKSPIQKGALGAFASFAGYNSYRWFIMGNMSSALINLTQSLIQYGMLAGKYGPVKAFQAMRDASSMYFRGGRDNNTSVENPFTGRAMNDLTFGGDKSKLSQDEKDLYDIAVSRGAIRRSTGQDLMQMREKGIDDPTSKWVQTQHWLGWMFQNTERFNREVGLLAAYKLARQNGVPHLQAIDQAINEVGEVHGSAMAELGPEYFQSGFGKIIGTFKRFAMSQIYLQYKLMRDMFKGASPEVKREAAMQYLAINSVAWTFAGLKGMPIFGIANLATSVLDWMFGDDDEPFDLDNFVLANLGNAMYRGPIGALINADIGSRSGFSDLLWRPDPQRLAEVGLGAYVMEQMLGPAFGIYKSVEQGVEHFNNGDLYRALESSSPAAIRNTLKGLRFATEGAVNTKGYPIDDDISAKDTFMQILGFTPNDVADKYARNNIMKQTERRMDEKKRSLLARHNLARSERDFDEMREIRAEMVEFNRSTFGRLMPITFGERGTLEKSWSAWNQQRQAALYGVVLKPKLKQALKEEAGVEE